MKKLRCKKELGVWFYEKETPTCYNDLDAPIYRLYDENQIYVVTCGCYDEMKYFIETGNVY